MDADCTTDLCQYAAPEIKEWANAIIIVAINAMIRTQTHPMKTKRILQMLLMPALVVLISLSMPALAQTESCGSNAADTVSFSRNSSTLSDEAQTSLRTFSQGILPGTCRVVILGNGGGSKIDEARANAVMGFLTGQGQIDPSRISISYSDQVPTRSVVLQAVPVD